jgi:isopentenyl phosphate kinase
MTQKMIFLKLGGSLITEKSRERAARTGVIRRLAGEIAAARRERSDLRIVLGHGSGSFGHMAASRYGTTKGVRTSEEWRGFAEVGRAADRLNRLVMDALAEAGVPALRFAPGGCARMDNGVLVEMPSEPVQAALDAGLVPVVYGDAVFDRIRGGGIASTEMVFACLARALPPERILLAGIELGVFEDYPACKRLITRIRAGEWEKARPAVEGSAQTDVTGGMLSKVAVMMMLVRQQENLKVLIFSGEREGSVRDALLGRDVEGTWLEK